MPLDAGERLARNVRDRRKALGLTLSDLSERLGRLGRPFGVSTLSRLELGDRQCTVDDLEALATALEVAPGELLSRGDENAMARQALVVATKLMTMQERRDREVARMDEEIAQWETVLSHMTTDPVAAEVVRVLREGGTMPIRNDDIFEEW